MSNEDERWMRHALRLARKGRGRTSPNPMVGAVLVKNGRVAGEGFHVRAGEPHAEVVALDRAGERARDATLYLNLEPCTHYGRTPPCAPVVIQARVRRVVIGMQDPNPLVRGRGIESLGKAGLEVKVGVLEKECRRLNEAFCKFIERREPFVILKAAATLDGKIATRGGESKWISGEASRRFVHRLRDEVDGILVGVGTVLKDNPQLTTRLKGGRNPYRIILDSHLRIPEDARVFGTSPSETIVMTTKSAPGGKKERMEKKGVQVLIVDSNKERVALKACLSKLGEKGIISLMVEGGSQINGSFLDEGLIDKLLLFLSPRIIGDKQAPGMFDGKGAASLKETILLREVRTRRIGEDILIEGYIKEAME